MGEKLCATKNNFCSVENQNQVHNLFPGDLNAVPVAIKAHEDKRKSLLGFFSEIDDVPMERVTVSANTQIAVGNTTNAVR